MNKSYTLTSSAVMYVCLGSLFFIFPNILPGVMGFELGGGAAMVARSYGGLLVGMGVANWLARGLDANVNRNLYIANIVWHPLSAIAIFQAIQAGYINLFGYGFLVVHAVWIIGFSLLLKDD